MESRRGTPAVLATTGPCPGLYAQEIPADPRPRSAPRIAPPPFQPRVSTPHPEGCSARRCHPTRPVPSSWFLTTSTACSTRGPAGLLHPAPGPGVHDLAGVQPRPVKVDRCGRSDHAVTLRRLPLVGSRAASPRPLPPWRSRRGTPDPPSSESTLPFPHKKLEPYDHHYSFAPRC
jgi:hypothetical protein